MSAVVCLLTDPDQVPVSNWSARLSLRDNRYDPYQLGDWMQVDRAAPRPVPVHIRMPRLYSVDVFDTPAN